MGGRVIHETIKPIRDSGESNVKVDAGKDNVAKATINKHHSTVPVTQVGDLLGFEVLRGVDRGAGVREAGGKDILATRTGKAVPNPIGLLKETQGIWGGVEGGE